MQEVFSALSQSGSRYWHSRCLWLSIDRPCQAVQCHAMGLKQSMLGAGGQFELLFIHFLCALKLMLMLTGMSNTFIHTKHVVSLAAVFKDLRLVKHRYTHMYAWERTVVR